MMKLALQAFPESITDQAKVHLKWHYDNVSMPHMSFISCKQDDMTPLHFICANECVTPDLLTEFFFFDRQNNTCSLVDSVSAMVLPFEAPFI